MNEKKYVVKVGNGYFSRYDELDVIIVIDDFLGSDYLRKVFNKKEQAEEVAEHIGGEVEEVHSGE